MSIEDNHRWPKPNHNYVPEYQMSGIPFVGTYQFSGNNVDPYKKQLVSFEQVTRWIQILNHNDNANTHIFLFFNENEADDFLTKANANPGSTTDVFVGSAGGHHIRIDKSQYTVRYELKCKQLWLVGPDDDIFSVIAGLTNISSNTFPDQTALNGFTGVESQV